MLSTQEQIDQAFALCKLQAASDGAFDDILLRHWFDASFDICARMVGLVFPAQAIQEAIRIDNQGRFRLSYRPSSEVRIFAGYTLIAILPPSLERSHCDPSLCCHCHLRAHYTVGSDDACAQIPPRFIQAVARLFTYCVENRGDVQLDDQILGKSGALAFLEPDLTYVL